MRKIAIISPTHNEKTNIKNFIEKIFSLEQDLPHWDINLVIVDSESTDGTVEIIKSLIKKYKKLSLLQTKKQGLGKAYIDGFKYALEKINPYLIIQIDADGQHNPKLIPNFIKEIEKGADFVIGTRYSLGGSIPKNWGIHRKFLSYSANLLMKFGFMKININDWTSGFRAIKSWIIRQSLNHIKNYSGYVFQIALLDFALKNGAIIKETPIKFEERKGDKSKINAFQYSIQSFFYMITHSSFIKFVIVGFLGFIVDLSFAFLFINKLNLSKPISNMISAEMAIIFNFLMNNFWSFKEKKIQGNFSQYLIKFFTFNFISSGSIFIQGGGIKLALKIFGDKYFQFFSFNISSWVIYKIFIIGFIIIPYSYILYNKIIWKK